MGCNNREFQFTEDSLLARVQEFLAAARRKHRLRLLHYCFMTNHLHLVVRVPDEDTLSRAMHDIANGFSRWFNATHRRCGHL